MEILRLLDQFDWIDRYDVQDFRQWAGGFYYRLTIFFENASVLYVREYVDEIDRAYAYHWQDHNNAMLTRWDNAPHHKQIATYPHHKHTPEGIFENSEITLADVLEEIRKQVSSQRE